MKSKKILINTVLATGILLSTSTITNLNAAETSSTYTVNTDVALNSTIDVKASANITDANLKKALNEDYFNKPANNDITQAQMQSLTGAIHLENKGIKNIKGLEYATNITQVFAQGNEISDFTPMQNLTKLEKINIEKQQASSVKLMDLSKLTHLTYIAIGYNHYTNFDINQLKSLSNLKTAYLQELGITDLSFLASIKQLNVLSLKGNGISDISLLSQMTNLTSLYLEYNNIIDVTPIKNLTNLKVLNLHSNQINNIDTLSKLTQLEKLYIGANNISSISVLSNYKNLQHLEAFDNNISNINSLSSLKNLTYLNLWGNPIENISAISNLSSLNYLSLSSTNIKNVNDISNLVNLTELYLSYTNIDDISPLKTLTNLEHFSIRDTNVTDISVISNFTKLDELFIDNNSIIDISAINAPLNIGYYAQNQTIDIDFTGDTIPNYYVKDKDGKNVPITFTDLGHGKYQGTWNWDNGNYTGTVNATRVLNFDNGELKEAVNKELGQLKDARITQEQVESLTKLDISNKNITSLKDLEYAINLVDLNLSNTKVDNLNTLKSLSNLKTLDISSVDTLNDISALAELDNVTNLNISDLQNVTDFTSLQGMDNLIALFAENNPNLFDNDISPLINLEILDLSDNNIIDTKFLSTLVNLKTLNLNNNNIIDLSFIENLNQLNTVNLSSNYINDISSLTSNTSITSIDLSNNYIMNFSPLMNNVLTSFNGLNQTLEFIFGTYKDVNNIPTTFSIIDKDGNKREYNYGLDISTITKDGVYNYDNISFDDGEYSGKASITFMFSSMQDLIPSTPIEPLVPIGPSNPILPLIPLEPATPINNTEDKDTNESNSTVVVGDNKIRPPTNTEVINENLPKLEETGQSNVIILLALLISLASTLLLIFLPNKKLFSKKNKY